MNPDETNQTNISNNIYHEISPSWSANGSKIIFSSDNPEGSVSVGITLYIIGVEY